MEGPWFEYLYRQNNRLALGPNMTRVQWVPGHITVELNIYSPACHHDDDRVTFNILHALDSSKTDDVLPVQGYRTVVR
jgi:hypothetical protein